MITLEQVKAMPDGSIIRRKGAYYKLAKVAHNPHDLWFWRINHRTGRYTTGRRSQVLRAYTGSKRLPADISWLANAELA